VQKRFSGAVDGFWLCTLVPGETLCWITTHVLCRDLLAGSCRIPKCHLVTSTSKEKIIQALKTTGVLLCDREGEIQSLPPLLFKILYFESKIYAPLHSSFFSNAAGPNSPTQWRWQTLTNQRYVQRASQSTWHFPFLSLCAVIKHYLLSQRFLARSSSPGPCSGLCHRPCHFSVCLSDGVASVRGW